MRWGRGDEASSGVHRLLSTWPFIPILVAPKRRNPVSRTLLLQPHELQTVLCVYRPYALLIPTQRINGL